MNKSPIILALDSSNGLCSVAVWKDSAVSAYLEENSPNLQSKRLILMAEEVLLRSGVGYNDLSAVACSVGPGSFTGIRISLASSRGIGFAADIPVLAFSSLEVIAFAELQKNQSNFVSVMMNAGKGEVIYQNFDAELNSTCPPTLKKANGDESFTSPRADILVTLAAIYPKKSVPPLPFYVRPPDAKLPSCYAT